MSSHGIITAVPHLLGEVTLNGVAALRVDTSVIGSGRTKPASPIPLQPPHRPVSENSSDGWSSEQSSQSSEDDYDRLAPDPAAAVGQSRGDGIEKGRADSDVNPGSWATPDGSVTSDADKRFEAIRGTPMDGGSSQNGRRKSIQVILEKTSKKGRYILTADDPEIREILRYGIERESIANGGAKKPRTRFRDLVFTRQFTTFDRQNPLSSESPFAGFFTLFWLCVAMLLIRVAASNWRKYGTVFGGNEMWHMMFDRDVVVMGLTDGFMCASTVVGLGLQKLILRGYLTWNGSGWVIQNVWQTFYLFAVIGWTFYREWPWTHTIFIVLHCMVFIMKQHSYAFYNGYLSQLYKRRALLEEKLWQLDDTEPIQTPISPPASPSTSFASTSIDRPDPGTVSRRTRSQKCRTSTDFQTEKSQIANIASAISSGKPLDENQLRTFSEVIRAEIRSLTDELGGKSTDKCNAYPNNLTLSNFADWTCLPTLVYELEYPRQDSINWWYVAEKTAATLGIIWVMMVISQAYIYPPISATVAAKEAGLTLTERWKEFPWLLSDLLFPILLEHLLSWYVIWECLLNVLAEVTLFADRGFYGDWWNSVSWDQYARDWNRPVHNFLLRHVYHSSISSFHFSKTTATLVTFMLSALVHELVMFCLFKKVRGYLFAMQLLQLPLVSLSRTRLLKGRRFLGNTVFWFGLFVGPSLLTSLYLVV